MTPGGPSVAVVLAGGLSRRFGRPKPLFSPGHGTVVGWIAATLRGLGLRVYVSAPDQVFGEVLRVAAGPLTGLLVDEELPCGGPARAMATALRLGEDTYLFVPGDMPWFSRDMASKLLQLSAQEVYSSTVPAWRNGHLETLLTVVGVEGLKALRTACTAKGAAKARPSDALRASRRIRVLPASLLLHGSLDDRPLLHINTPEDYPYPSPRGERGPLMGPLDIDNTEASRTYLEALSSAASDPRRAARLFEEEAELLLEAGLHFLAAQAYRDAYYVAMSAELPDAARLAALSGKIYDTLEQGGVKLW